MRPGSFFYYSSLEGERKDWIKKLLSERQIFFRSRDQLNDINELRPKFGLGGDKKSQIAYVRQQVEKRGTELSPAQKLLVRGNLLRRLTMKNGNAEKDLYEILDRTGILSVSETLDSHTLWGSYADKYRGIAIEFDSSKGLFAHANKVVYQEETPWAKMLEDSDETATQKFVLTKLNQWEHEREWRVIARWSDPPRIDKHLNEYNYADNDVATFIRASHGSGYYQIPIDSIRAIVLGPQISKPDQSWLQSLVKDLRMANLLVKAVRNPNGSISKAGRVDQA